MSGQVLYWADAPDEASSPTIVAAEYDGRSSLAMESAKLFRTPARGAPTSVNDGRWLDALAALHLLKAHFTDLSKAKSAILAHLKSGRIRAAALKSRVLRRTGSSAAVVEKAFGHSELDPSAWNSSQLAVIYWSDGTPSCSIEIDEGPKVELFIDHLLFFRADINALIPKNGIIAAKREKGGRNPDIQMWTDLAIALVLYERNDPVGLGGRSQAHLEKVLSSALDQGFGKTTLNQFARKVFEKVVFNSEADEAFKEFF